MIATVSLLAILAAPAAAPVDSLPPARLVSSDDGHGVHRAESAAAAAGAKVHPDRLEVGTSSALGGVGGLVAAAVIGYGVAGVVSVVGGPALASSAAPVVVLVMVAALPVGAGIGAAHAHGLVHAEGATGAGVAAGLGTVGGALAGGVLGYSAAKLMWEGTSDWWELSAAIGSGVAACVGALAGSAAGPALHAALEDVE